MKYVLWALGVVVVAVTALVVWPKDGESQQYLAETGQHRFELTPASTKTGVNSFDLEITDRAGNPAKADSVTVEPAMPQMGHAVSPITAGPREPGRYKVENVDLPMAGQWEITVSISTGSLDGSERVVFPLLLN
jgi:nitrogen fixation protein FixH